jgi:hypothetical protein
MGYASDIFISRYDSVGNITWSERAGGSGEDLPRSIVVDASGNLYIMGLTISTTFTIGGDALTHLYGEGMFVAKLNANGNTVRVKILGYSYFTGNSIAVDQAGNTYITGTFDGDSLVLDTITLRNDTLGNFQMFVVKYDTGGNVVWARSVGISGGAVAIIEGLGVIPDDAGNVCYRSFYRNPNAYFWI